MHPRSLTHHPSLLVSLRGRQRSGACGGMIACTARRRLPSSWAPASPAEELPVDGRKRQCISPRTYSAMASRARAKCVELGKPMCFASSSSRRNRAPYREQFGCRLVLRLLHDLGVGEASHEGRACREDPSSAPSGSSSSTTTSSTSRHGDCSLAAWCVDLSSSVQFPSFVSSCAASSLDHRPRTRTRKAVEGSVVERLL